MKLLAIDHRLCGADRIMSASAGNHERTEVYGAANRPDVKYETYNGVAVIMLYGTMNKYIYDPPYIDSTIRVRSALAQANRDKSVSRILLLVSSPGGHVEGTDELATAVRDSAKPVMAYCEDMCASAGYYVASQASQVFANEAAIVGSIGTLAYVVDDSEYWARMGIKWHRVATGEAKGSPGIGEEVTEESLRPIQSVVDAMGEMFFAAVQRARGFSREEMERVTTGEYWIASEAREMGLIDGIQNWETTLGAVSRLAASDRRKRIDERRMRTAQAACGLRRVSVHDIAAETGQPVHRVRRALAKLGIQAVSAITTGGRPAKQYPKTAVESVRSYCECAL